jgi:hypothetical protein
MFANSMMFWSEKHAAFERSRWSINLVRAIHGTQCNLWLSSVLYIFYVDILKALLQS